MAQEALDDAILIGCSEAHVRDALHRLIDALTNAYAPRRGTVAKGTGYPSLKVDALGE